MDPHSETTVPCTRETPIVVISKYPTTSPSFESNRALELTSQIRPGRHGSDRFLIR